MKPASTRSPGSTGAGANREVREGREGNPNQSPRVKHLPDGQTSGSRPGNAAYAARRADDFNSRGLRARENATNSSKSPNAPDTPGKKPKKRTGAPAGAHREDVPDLPNLHFRPPPTRHPPPMKCVSKSPVSHRKPIISFAPLGALSG